jgi:steroid 5-alpha reductase family enzyme
MDTGLLLSLLHESIYLILVFSLFFCITLWKGHYALINIIFSLYLALLLTLEFPYFQHLSQGDTTQDAIIKILLFVGITVAGIFIFRRHIPGDDYEKAFSLFGKKIILSLLATSLVMAFSYHALPVTEFIHPGTPIQTLFASEAYFFWWLIVPLLLLFFL